MAINTPTITSPDDPQPIPLFWKRMDYPDVVYQTEEAKLRAIVKEIIYFHVIGRPQLVGTTSVENSERLSERLNATNVRRLLEVFLIRHAYIQKNNLQGRDVMSTPELDQLYAPLDQLRSPELRRLGREYGLIPSAPWMRTTRRACWRFSTSPLRIGRVWMRSSKAGCSTRC
jgi:preprotein translocase subunit SecA